MAIKRKGKIATLERVLSRGMRSSGEILYKASKVGGKGVSFVYGWKRDAYQGKDG